MTNQGPIYIDFDDVLCETARALAELVARRFDKRVPFEDIRFFDLRLSFGLTDDETAFLMQAFHDGDLLSSFDPVPGAVEGVNTWRSAGRAVWIVTGRPPGTYEVSRRWLCRHGVPFDRLIMVDKYDRNHCREEGVPMMTMQEVYTAGFALVVEDSLDMADAILKNAGTPVALLDRPWNAGEIRLDEANISRFCRCRDWPDLIRRHPRP